jgi:quinol monooxygenase YgiN
MKHRTKGIGGFFLVILTIYVSFIAAGKPEKGQGNVQAAVKMQSNELMIRIAEIEVYPDYLEEYKAILKEEAEASIRLEPGVISIFPMYQRDNPTQIRILEIYANREAYESHLASPHFQKYKSTTLHMVHSLYLLDMETIDEAQMINIFSKLQQLSNDEE